MKNDKMLPGEIEEKSFSIITQELGNRKFSPDHEPIIKRTIHATADFDYADNLYFSQDAVEEAHKAIVKGTTIITDTQMIRAGINKKAAAKFGCQVLCYMDDEQVEREAKKNGSTRAVAAVNKAALQCCDGIFVVGNAPTALLRICELVREKALRPQMVIGVPVGFVNVVESKESLVESGLLCIAAKERKGGSTVAVAIVNALLYGATKEAN